MFKRALILVITTLVPLLAYGETGYKKGTVEYFRVHDDSISSWEPPVFWFTLKGVSSAGSCPTWNGNVLFVATSQYAYSFVMATYMAGKEMALRYDDTYKHESSYCIVKHVTGGDPPPTF